MGGHCLPVDPLYLSWRARQFDMTTKFIELADKINPHVMADPRGLSLTVSAGSFEIWPWS
jgi:hypothetical protein